MRRFIHPTPTPARLRYLAQLADGQARRVTQRGRVGYDCRVLGWCRFAVRDLRSGEIIPSPEGSFWSDDGSRLYEYLVEPLNAAEIITPEGLRVLLSAASLQSLR